MGTFSPKLPPGIRRLFRLPQNSGRLIRDMDEELEAHLAMRVEELRALGLSESEAVAEARRRFGDTDEFKEYAERRAGRRASRLRVAWWVEDFTQDVRMAARQFRRAPALSIVVVLTLALCIGATTASYSVVRHLLLAPLPYEDGNRIASLEALNRDEEIYGYHITGGLYRLWELRAGSLEEFAAHDPRKLILGGGSTADSIRVEAVTPSFLSMLRVHPSLGRAFAPADARPGAPAVAMLSDAVWRGRFGGALDVVGRSVDLGGVPRTIIGVVPPDVGIPVQGDEREPTAIWLPLNVDSKSEIEAFARLRPGVTSAAASRELDAILHTLPDTGWLNKRRGVARTAPDRVDPAHTGVEVLLAAAVGLLLIACADVAGLLLIRGWARRREFAIRQSLGAARGRLVRQLLSESLLLAAPSGALGLYVAWIGLRAANGRLGLGEVHLDTVTLVSGAAAAMTTALLFSIGPAFLAWEGSLDVALRGGGPIGGTSRSARRAHAGLVVIQIALSLVFLATAAVLARSFVALVRTPLGYKPEGLVEVRVQHLAPGERSAAMRTIRESLAATPGVDDVALGTLPMTYYFGGPTVVDGATGVRSSDVTIVGGAWVSPEYFRVAAIPILRGRGLDVNSAVAARQVLVNQRLARLLWPDRDAIGARLGWGKGASAKWRTVVGIVGDVQMPGRRDGFEFFGLQMYRLTGGSDSSLLLRAQSDPARLRSLLARAVERAGVGATLGKVVSAESTTEFVFRGPRIALSLYGAFALLAVVLAALGLFGIVAFAVARRTREIGIRVALGAEPAALTRTIVGQSLSLVGVGCAIGLVGAFAAARAMAALLYGVSPTDPAALGAAVVLLAVIAVAASAVPVRRALSIDPTETLRAE